MSFKESIAVCFDKFATFKGRASRSEYWWWVLFTYLVGVVAACIDHFCGLHSVFSGVASILFLIPNFAVGVRRCHDTNHSGWWLLCPIYNFILMLLPSEPEE